MDLQTYAGWVVCHTKIPIRISTSIGQKYDLRIKYSSKATLSKLWGLASMKKPSREGGCYFCEKLFFTRTSQKNYKQLVLLHKILFGSTTATCMLKSKYQPEGDHCSSGERIFFSWVQFWSLYYFYS